MEQFNRDKYKSRRYVMHCETQEEFTNFLKYLDSLGEKWGEENNSLLQLFATWQNYKERTVFYFNNGNAGVGTVNTAEKSGYIVLKYSDFDFKEELKMKFDITKYSGKFAMHCKTEQEAKEFCDLLHWAGRTWNSGHSYREYTNWENHREETAYSFNEDRYCPVDWYIRNGYQILEWSDFKDDKPKQFTKADLKTGDVCKQRDGVVQVYLKEFDSFITPDGWNSARKLLDDLTHAAGKQFDIVAVRRPESGADCMFTAFDNFYGKLIFERKEPEEMTLEEVCRLLGKEIKIVK